MALKSRIAATYWQRIKGLRFFEHRRCGTRKTGENLIQSKKYKKVIGEW
jgi:hypothetical protein